MDVVHGQQPMSSADDALVLVYNGAVFNHPSLMAQLQGDGVRYRTHCDTETVLHVFERRGEAAPEELRGMFAYAVWDKRDRSLTLARDWDAAMMRDNDYLPPSGWGVRRSLFEELGGFDPAFAFSEDWDFVLRAARVTQPRRVPGVTVEVRMRASGNASADFGERRLACLRQLEVRHGLPALEPRTFWEVAQHVASARA